MALEFQLKGIGPVLKRMDNFSKEFQKKAVKTAVRAGANVIKKAAIANANEIDDPNTPMRIADRIAVQYASRLAKRVGGVAYRVGVLGGAKEAPDIPWYWRFVEFGVPSNNVPARPFMLPALEANGEQAMDAIVKSLDRAITRLIKKGVI